MKNETRINSENLYFISSSNKSKLFFIPPSFLKSKNPL